MKEAKEKSASDCENGQKKNPPEKPTGEVYELRSVNPCQDEHAAEL